MQYRMSDTARAVLNIETREHLDDTPDVSYLDQEEFADRRDDYRRGDFHFIGIDARAELIVDHVTQEIVSGGLWGIESDSGEDHLREIAGEELASLASILRTLGFTADELRDQWPEGFTLPE